MKYPGLIGREARLAEVLALLLQQAGHAAAAPSSVEALLEAADQALATSSVARDQRAEPPARRAQLSTTAARCKLDEMGFSKVDPSDSEVELAWVLANGIRAKNRYFHWAPEDLGSWLPEGQRKTLTDQVIMYVENAAESGNLELADALGAVLGVSMYETAPSVSDALDTTMRAFDMLAQGADFNQVVEKTGVTRAVSVASAAAHAADQAAADASRPVVVVTMSGGMVESISATQAADVIVLDDDVGTSDPADLTEIGGKPFRVTERSADTRAGSTEAGSTFVWGVLADLDAAHGSSPDPDEVDAESGPRA